jgi:hypothetical protein
MQQTVRNDMSVNDHEKLSNFTLIHNSKKWYGCKWSWETIQLYTNSQQ